MSVTYNEQKLILNRIRSNCEKLTSTFKTLRRTIYISFSLAVHSIIQNLGVRARRFFTFNDVKDHLLLLLLSLILGM